MTTRFITPLLVLALCSCEPSSQESSRRNESASPAIPASLVDSPGLSGENALYHAARLVDIGDRSTASPGYRKQLDYLTAQLKKEGWVCLEQTFVKDTPAGPVTFTNLRARLDDRAQFNSKVKLLLSCHIDTKKGINHFVGANDGASGAALMLEIARILSKEPETARDMELVFFDGEESFGEHITAADGLYGSTYYTEELKDSLPTYLINLDMVGRQGMKIRIPPDTPVILYDLYRDAVNELQLPSHAWGVAANGIIDDHIPFARQGVISINLIDDFKDGNWWHSERDNLAILSAGSFADSGNVTLYMIRQLLKPR